MTFVWLAVVVLGVIGLGAVVWVVLRARTDQVRGPQQPGPHAGPLDGEGLVKAGRKQDAVKEWRSRHGVAPRAVAESQARPPPPPVGTRDEPSRQVTEQDIRHQLRHGNVIDAIKLYREKTGVGLREAKEAVESIRHRMRAS